MVEDNESVKRGGSPFQNCGKLKIDTVFEAVVDHYKQDLREFFTRSNFYLAVQTALLSVFGFRDIPDSLLDYIVMTVIIAAGLAIAVIWWVAARGSILWIDRWRREVQRLSQEHSPTGSYDEIEQTAKAHPYQSPERVTKLLPLLFGLIWFTFAAILVYWFSWHC